MLNWTVPQALCPKRVVCLQLPSPVHFSRRGGGVRSFTQLLQCVGHRGTPDGEGVFGTAGWATSAVEITQNL